MGVMLMRPRGSLGEIGKAMREQALQHPGTVRDLAIRSQVGLRCARYTATRLVQCGVLAPMNPGERPAVLGPAMDAPPPSNDDAVVMLSRAFWLQGSGMVWADDGA